MLLKRLSLKRKKPSEDGFTLIELLVVIVILGILAAIAIPVFLNQQKAAINATIKSDVANSVIAVSDALFGNPNAIGFTVLHAGDTQGFVSIVPSSVVIVPVGDVAVKVAESKDNIISVTGTSDNYKVTGMNLSSGEFAYQYDSTSGDYYDNTSSRYVAPDGTNGSGSLVSGSPAIAGPVITAPHEAGYVSQYGDQTFPAGVSRLVQISFSVAGETIDNQSNYNFSNSISDHGLGATYSGSSVAYASSNPDHSFQFSVGAGAGYADITITVSDSTTGGSTSKTFRITQQ